MHTDKKTASMLWNYAFSKNKPIDELTADDLPEIKNHTVNEMKEDVLTHHKKLMILHERCRDNRSDEIDEHDVLACFYSKTLLSDDDIKQVKAQTGVKIHPRNDIDAIIYMDDIKPGNRLMILHDMERLWFGLSNNSITDGRIFVQSVKDMIGTIVVPFYVHSWYEVNSLGGKLETNLSIKTKNIEKEIKANDPMAIWLNDPSNHPVRTINAMQNGYVIDYTRTV